MDHTCKPQAGRAGGTMDKELDTVALPIAETFTTAPH